MVVYNDISSVEKDLGFTAKTLYALSNNISGHYQTHYIPKRDGTRRTLSVPDKILKKVQKAISEKLLVYEPVSEYARAYSYGSSVQKNALPHVGKEKILKLDIKNFFGSIMYSKVKNSAFPARKYSENIRILLCMLCYYKDSLPQGAPSSPVISNIIMKDFDEDVGIWCKKRNISYTRYCDDLTFSGNFDETETEKFVKEKLAENGFYLNDRKTAVINSHNRQTVTGITVNKKLNIPAEYKRNIRKEIYFCQKYGVKNHLQHLNSEAEPKNYLFGLLGKIAFVLQTCPENKEFREYKKYVMKLLTSDT